jgi:hypothetical protein
LARPVLIVGAGVAAAKALRSAVIDAGKSIFHGCSVRHAEVNSRRRAYYSGPLDLRAQAEVLSALRTDTPPHDIKRNGSRRSSLRSRADDERPCLGARLALPPPGKEAGGRPVANKDQALSR